MGISCSGRVYFVLSRRGQIAVLGTGVKGEMCGSVSVPHKPQVHILPLSRSMGFRVVAVVLVTYLKTGVLEEKVKEV